VTKIAPSILAADFGRLREEVEAVERAGADWIHVDVMDGHFVPNLTIGPPVVEALRKCTSLPLDVHLMITNPERYIADYASAGADHILVHQETCPHLHAVLQDIRKHKARPGVVLNPATPFELLEPVLADIEILLVMSVNPGFGGQQFIESALDKLRRARARRQELGLKFAIEVDGGIKVGNAGRVSEAGADVLVVGTGIFSTGDYAATIAELRRATVRPGALRG
jgi:ribulose-phosphate 3-epimerase